MMVAVVIAATAVTPPVAAVRYPEYAPYGSDRAADTGSDRAANHTADRAGHAVALGGPFLCAANDTLSMCGMGYGEQRQRDGHDREEGLDGQTGPHRLNADI